VRQQDIASVLVALPHPSPRNLRWLKANPWFERDIVPALRRKVAAALAGDEPTSG
jgi:uracil-DNA glycosylase